MSAALIENHDCHYFVAAAKSTMSPVSVIAAAAVVLCAVGAILALPVTGRRRETNPKEEHHHHQHRYYRGGGGESGESGRNTTNTEMEGVIVKFLDVYYDKYVKPPTPMENIYDQMQSDQPVTHNPDFLVANGTDYASMKRG